MKYCEYCGKEIIKRDCESSEYFKRKKYCSRECFGAAHHAEYLARPEVQEELENKRKRIEYSKELSKYCNRNFTHVLYNTWKNMRRRCDNPNIKCYKNYGGRGIKVCEEWNKDPLAFINWALSHGWKKGLTIDRIDNNDNYSPDNCRWITRREQLLNRRNNRMMTFNGKTQTMREWADEVGISYRTLCSRMNRNGWSVEKALTEPIDTSKIRTHKAV